MTIISKLNFWCDECKDFTPAEKATIPIHWMRNGKDMNDVSYRHFCKNCQTFLFDAIEEES